MWTTAMLELCFAHVVTSYMVDMPVEALGVERMRSAELPLTLTKLNTGVRQVM